MWLTIPYALHRRYESDTRDVQRDTHHDNNKQMPDDRCIYTVCNSTGNYTPTSTLCNRILSKDERFSTATTCVVKRNRKLGKNAFIEATWGF